MSNVALATADGWAAAHIMALDPMIVLTPKTLQFAAVCQLHQLHYLRALTLVIQIATTVPVMPFAQVMTGKRLIVSAGMVFLGALL